MNTRYGAGNCPSNTLWCKRRPAGVYQQSTGLLIEWVRAPAAPKKRALAGSLFWCTTAIQIRTGIRFYGLLIHRDNTVFRCRRILEGRRFFHLQTNGSETVRRSRLELPRKSLLPGCPAKGKTISEWCLLSASFRQSFQKIANFSGENFVP